MDPSWYDITGDPQGWVEMMRYYVSILLPVAAGISTALLAPCAIVRFLRWGRNQLARLGR
jgi:hypothetical protein